MTIVSAVVVYVLVWWTTLFCVLPIGARPDSEGDPAAGGWRGAPTNPRIGMKLLATTVLAAVLTLAIWGVVDSDLISFRSGWLALPEK